MTGSEIIGEISEQVCTGNQAKLMKMYMIAFPNRVISNFKIEDNLFIVEYNIAEIE